MNVEIGPEAAQFPEKEYINVIFVAVWWFFCVVVQAGQSRVRRHGPDVEWTQWWNLWSEWRPMLHSTYSTAVWLLANIFGVVNAKSKRKVSNVTATEPTFSSNPAIKKINKRVTNWVATQND